MGSQSIRFLQQAALVTIIILLFGCKTNLYSAPAISMNQENLSDADKNIIALRNMIPIYEEAASRPWPRISRHAKLKLHAHNQDVLLLREKLLATNDLLPANNNGGNLFDVQLAEAVKIFQLRHGLKVDGIIGEDTLYELNISPQQRLNQIGVNIRRWQSLSNELGNRYIMVNVPAYHLDVVENGKSILGMKAIIGKPDRQTPELESTVTTLVMNPYWNIPKMIAQKDIVPKVIDDPNYLSNEHIEILQSQNDNAAIINSTDVDWQDALNNGFKYHFRQDPGAWNALGLIKFEFENNDNVYLHDTPAKDLFDLDKRAFSSGCIRLEKPFELAAYLMRDDPKWNDERIKGMLEIGKTSYIRATKPTQIVITYITAWVDENGLLEFRDDLYGRDNIQ
jgi:murein L,D-transpeptidase YcbB/YkuD